MRPDGTSHHLRFIEAPVPEPAQARGFRTLWIGLGTLVAAALIVNVGVIVILICRRQITVEITHETESKGELPSDGENSVEEMVFFFPSGENTQTLDRHGPVPNEFKQANPDESFYGSLHFSMEGSIE
jgi:hypothetical protein